MGVLRSFDHPEFVDGYEYYAKTVLVKYADRVGTWYSFNEPTMEANLMRQWNYSRNVLLAHARVVRWYRDEIKGKGKWSMKLDLSDTGFAIPLNPSNETDVQAAVRRNDFSFGYFANPLFKGENVPEAMAEVLGDKVPQYTPEELEYINGTADFFAFDIYTATYHSEPAGGFKQCAENKKHPEWPACTTRSTTRGMWESNFHGNVDRPAVCYLSFYQPLSSLLPSQPQHQSPAYI
jgi:beta-glucosidase/6-phospho-beta-glucosidase/beta-galactosidase